MGGGQHRGLDHERSENDVDLQHRTGALTSDDTATVVGLCVSLLAVLTGVFVYIACIGLLIVLSHRGFHWWKS